MNIKEYIILNDKNIGVGKVIIIDSNAVINNKKTSINRIEIYSSDFNYKFTFWTHQEYYKFNELILNIKTDIIDLVDDYDIEFEYGKENTINTRKNAKMYFTRIDDNKYILDVVIDNFCNISEMFKKLELQAIIDFDYILKAT